MRLTASNIVAEINRLSKDNFYNYINPRNRGKIKIASVTLPEGPIVIQRNSSQKRESISVKMIWRYANSLLPGQPVNVDRLFAGSYNTRSVLESLLAHTPNFFWCSPGRIEQENATQKIMKGHKHLMWRPDDTHANGILAKFETTAVISEIPIADAIYDGLTVPSAFQTDIRDIDVLRRHLQIQIALAIIGHQLGFRTWIARNDQGLRWGEKAVGELDGIVVDLARERLMVAHEDAIKAALHIDCIWFRNGLFMPAVMEVEHSTGILSGLSRMKNLQDHLPRFPTRWVIVAPDNDRDKVMTAANRPQYKDLNTSFFSYSAVDELYSLCKRRAINKRAVNDEFLDCFMEPCLAAISMD